MAAAAPAAAAPAAAAPAAAAPAAAPGGGLTPQQQAFFAAFGLGGGGGGGGGGGNRQQPQPRAGGVARNVPVEKRVLEREKKIKGKKTVAVDSVLSGTVTTWFLRILFFAPVVLAGIYLSTQRQGSESFNLVLAGLILYSIFGGYLILDLINERYRKFIILMLMTITALGTFAVALGREPKNGLLVSCVVVTSIILFILFIYNVALLQYSASEILDIAPTLGNYIVKLDSLIVEPGYSALDDSDKDMVLAHRGKLIKYIERVSLYPDQYKDPYSAQYRELQRELDEIDSKYLGTNSMAGTGRVSSIINAIKTPAGYSNDQFLDRYQTDRSTFKGYMESQKKK